MEKNNNEEELVKNKVVEEKKRTKKTTGEKVNTESKKRNKKTSEEKVAAEPKKRTKKTSEEKVAAEPKKRTKKTSEEKVAAEPKKRTKKTREVENNIKTQNEEEKVIENNVSESNNKNNLKVKKSKKPKIIILCALIIGLVLLFTLTPYKLLFSSKKMTFLNYILKDLGAINSVTGKMENNKLIGFINDGSTKELNFDINLDSKSVAGQAIIDKEYLALKLNDITDNYLVVENKNLDQLLNKFGLQASGNLSEINFEDNPIMLTKGDKLKIFNFISDCLTKILTNLENEKFVVNSEDTLDINSKITTLKSVEMHLSEIDLFMLQKEVLEAVDKHGMLNLFINKINKISTSETINKKEVKAELEKYIAYIDYAKAYYELQNKDSQYYIVYKMYYDDENNVVAREIVEKYTYEGELYEDIICRVITNLNDYYEVKWFVQEDYSSAYYNIISDKITTNKSKQEHEIKHTVEGFYVEYAEGGEDYGYVPLNAENVYNLTIETAENGETKIELVEPNNLYRFNLNYIDNSTDLEFTTKYKELDISTKLSLKSTNITKEELVNDGAMIINDKAQEDLTAEFVKIGSKFSEIFVEPELEQVEE